MAEKKKTLIVLGAGASGMAAAIAAARAGAAVTILEKEDKAGRKLLATGNGRCNLTNAGSFKGAYHGGDPAFADKVLENLSPKETRDFFEGLGLYLTEESGRIYPYAGQSESVLHVLLRELSRLGVRIKCGENVLSAKKEGDLFSLRTRTWEYQANALILSAGTAASLTKKQLPANGSSLAEGFGHSLRPARPALVPLKVAEAGKYAFGGVRLRGRVTILADGEEIASDAGQLQLTENGISGIPVFNVSGRAAACLEEGRSVGAVLDFLPDLPERETLGLLWALSGKEEPPRSPRETLRGLLPERLVRSLLKSFGDREPSLKELARALRHFPLTVVGSGGTGFSQVLSGGVDTREVSPNTLGSRLVPGLYITGEMLDIDGICGGFNLQFAWSTGLLAGRAAAEALR